MNVSQQQLAQVVLLNALITQQSATLNEQVDQTTLLVSQNSVLSNILNATAQTTELMSSINKRKFLLSLLFKIKALLFLLFLLNIKSVISKLCILALKVNPHAPHGSMLPQDL